MQRAAAEEAAHLAATARVHQARLLLSCYAMLLLCCCYAAAMVLLLVPLATAHESCLICPRSLGACLAGGTLPLCSSLSSRLHLLCAGRQRHAGMAAPRGLPPLLPGAPWRAAGGRRVCAAVPQGPSLPTEVCLALYCFCCRCCTAALLLPIVRRPQLWVVRVAPAHQLDPTQVHSVRAAETPRRAWRGC